MASDAIRTVLYIDPKLHAAYVKDAAAHGREPNDHILRILEQYAVAQGLLAEEDSDEYRLMWSLIDRAVEEARRICRDGRFDHHVTRNAFAACMADPDYVSDYERYIRGNAYAHGNPRKSINKDIGQAIKAGIGGRVLRDGDGKPRKEAVTGAAIQSYTLIETFDPQVVG